MRFRFTLSHTVEGSIEISEPSGWKECILKLERDENFHSLIEYFDGSFIFYGTDGITNGGIDFIKQIELLYGVDATILIDIDLTFDESTFINVFNGQFKLSDLDELLDNQLRLPIIRDDFWSKFISRLDIPVNLQSATNEDGTSVDVNEQINLELTSQKIRYLGQYEWGDTHTYYEEDDFLGNFLRGMQLDFERVVIDDLKKFTIPRARITIDKNASVGIGPDDVGGVIAVDSLVGNFEAPYTGDYTFDIQFYSAQYSAGNWIGPVGSGTGTFFYVFRTTETAQTLLNQFTRTQISCGSDSIVRHNFNRTISLQRGEQIAIWGRGTGDITIFGNDRIAWHTIDLASNSSLVLSGEQTIDGVLTSASTILVKNQSDPSENGVYITAAGAWTRATFADTVFELNNIAVFISAGDTNINTAWKQNNEITSLLDSQAWTYLIATDERLKEFPCGFDVESYLRITADTVSAQTEAEGILIHDAAAAISDRIIGQNGTVYSELFGSSLTKSRQYEEDGCAWNHGLFKGLQLRQYTLEEKPFFMSFNQWWNGANPIFNLSLGYDVVESEDVIRIEEKEYQYDDSGGTSVDFSNVRDITRKYDNERIFNKVEIGYAKWQAEDISGIDDPQTKKTYSTRLQKVGKGIQLFSEWIAASLAIESTRRKTREKSSDYKFDNDTFIIALNPTEQVDVSPDESPDYVDFIPELDENFSLITNLINSDTRYNIGLTTGRNFLRWQNFLQGGLQAYVGSTFKFSSAEGNYDMTSIMDDVGCSGDDYDGDELDEKGNIPVTTEFIHLAHLYDATFPMEWSEYVQIRDNRRKPVGISKTDTGHVPMFIKTLSYKPVKGEATVLMWAKEYLDLSVIEDTTPTQECYPAPDFDPCEDALTDELGEILTDELGVCLTD